MQSVLRLELQRADVRLEHHRFYLRARILQREVEVAGVPETTVGNLCFDPDFGVRIFQNAADVRSEISDAEDGSCCACRRTLARGRFRRQAFGLRFPRGFRYIEQIKL